MTRTRKKKNSFKYLNLILIVFFLIISGISLLPHLFHRTPTLKDTTECDHVKYANCPIFPSNKLNDLNDAQLVHAEKNGLKKLFATNEEFNSKIDSLKKKYILIEVTENKFYQLKELTHSEPYLIPEAVDMLNEIGYRFQKRLKEKKYNNFRFRITSLLRTEETQNNLSHHNGNASSHSAHLYGTTVDISYKNFYNTKTDSIESSYEAVQALTYVLIQMRQECRLMAVRERHQSCFHITVVVCQPLSDKNYQHYLFENE